jgi:predicted RNA binding protein YcfA (HicA-like mRNA interferase family)
MIHLLAAVRWLARRAGAKDLQLGEVKVRDLMKLVEADDWRHVRTTGSHRHYKHPSKPNVVTIPGHPGDDVPAGTLKSILKAAGLEKK